MNDGYQYSWLNKLNASETQEINGFLSNCRFFTYFQSPAFFNVCQASVYSKPWYILARRQDMLVGVLLFFRQSQTNWPILSYLTGRSIIWGGPILADNEPPALLDGLLGYYERQRPRVQYTQIRNLVDTDSYQLHYTQAGFTYDEHLDILIDLTLPEPELWKAVHSKRKNQIRRAEKEGCTVQVATAISDLNVSYTILQEVYHRAKLPLPPVSHFEALLTQSNAYGGLRLFTVVHENQIIACMFCIVQGTWLYDYYAGAFRHAYKKFPNDLLPWAVFQWAKKQGYTQFSFGGAGKPGVPYGVRDYKKQFGGAFVNFGRYEKSHSGYLFELIKKLYLLWQRIRP